jgi:hypothetical protein
VHQSRLSAIASKRSIVIIRGKRAQSPRVKGGVESGFLQ